MIKRVFLAGVVFLAGYILAWVHCGRIVGRFAKWGMGKPKWVADTLIQWLDEHDAARNAAKESTPEPIWASRKFCEESSRHWSPDHDINLLFLGAINNHFNDKLEARGHVFLNEIYEELGLSHTASGAYLGWVLDGTDEYRKAIDFGLELINPLDEDILLSFNVDGDITSKLGEPDDSVDDQTQTKESAAV